MFDYQPLYYHLFNAITDALRLLEQDRPAEARARLMQAQIDTEEAYLSGGPADE